MSKRRVGNNLLIIIQLSVKNSIKKKDCIKLVAADSRIKLIKNL